MSVDYRPDYDPADVDHDYGHIGGDITVPTFQGNTKPFKFWCQKALPLVYDDSLSYYEVLCKMADYLNGFMTDLTTVEDSMTEFGEQFVINQQFLNTMADQLGQNVADLEAYINDRMDDFMAAYTQLQTYVNNYFDNLDVQEEINSKLDEMASDGTLNDLFDPVLETWMQQKNAQIDAAISNQNAVQAEQNGRISVLEGRMDTFEGLPAGSTAGNAELVGIRTNFLGEVYPTAGDAVRASDMIASGFTSIPITRLEEWNGNEASSTYDTIQFDVSAYKGGHVVMIANMESFVSTAESIGVGVVATNVSGKTADQNAHEYALTSNVFPSYSVIPTQISGEERIALFFSIPEDFSYQYLKMGYVEEIPNSDYTQPAAIVYANSWSKTQVDPTLTIAGDAADAKAAGDAIDELNERLSDVKSAFINSYNDEYPLLLNSKPNTYIDNTDGTEKPSINSYIASDYMPCENVIVLKTYSSARLTSNAFYDANKQFISSFAVPTGNGIIEIPANACYFRVSASASTFGSLIIENGWKREIGNIEKSIINSIQNEYPLLLNSKPNTYIDNTDGTEKPSINSYIASDYMPCENVIVLKTYSSARLTSNAFYDANKQFISSFAVPTGNGIIEIPANACYFRVSASENNLNNLKIEKIGIDKFEKKVIHCERGIISASANRYGGSSSQYGLYWKSYIVNKYAIVVSKASPVIYIPAISANNQNYSIYFRDETGALIGDRVQTPCSSDMTIVAPLNAMYFDIMVPSEQVIDVVFYSINSNYSVYESKRFDYNNTAESKCFFEIDAKKGLYTGLCYMLPPNYTHDGGKIPMVIWFDGNGNYNTMDNLFSQLKKPGLDYVRDEGFAVMQVFSWGNYYVSKQISDNPIGWDQPYPVPTCLDCIKKAIEYMVDRYNIDPDDVHIMAKSMGGIISTYFVNRPIWNFRSIGMFAPAMDVLALNGRDPSSRMGIAEELGFVGDNLTDFYDISIDRTKPEDGIPNFYYSPRCQHVWLDNMGCLARINPIWLDIIDTTLDQKYATSLSDAQAWHLDTTETDIYTHLEYKKLGIVPVKIWAATQDTDVPYRAIVQTISNWRNTGHHAEIRIANGGHSYFDVDSTPIEVVTVLGITHSVTCGWIENVQWIRDNSSHPPIAQNM